MADASQREKGGGNQGRMGPKESADNSPSPGQDESGIKKVLSSGESVRD